MSETALELILAIDKYMEKSVKTNYILTLEEQLELQRKLNTLNNHINLLVDYEVKRNKTNKTKKLDKNN